MKLRNVYYYRREEERTFTLRPHTEAKQTFLRHFFCLRGIGERRQVESQLWTPKTFFRRKKNATLYRIAYMTMHGYTRNEVARRMGLSEGRMRQYVESIELMISAHIRQMSSYSKVQK